MKHEVLYLPDLQTQKLRKYATLRSQPSALKSGLKFLIQNPVSSANG